MSLRENFKTVVAGMTSSDLAVAIEDDARDTASKIVPVLQLFLVMLSVQGDENISGEVSKLYEEYGGEFTICLQDGDVMNFLINEDGDLINTYDDGVHPNRFVNVLDSGELVNDFRNPDSSLLHTAKNSSTWSLFEVASSLSAQVQASTIMQRLANLCLSDNISYADVQSVIGDYVNVLTPEMNNLINNIKAIPGGVNPSTLLQVLHKVYVGFTNAVTRQDTIDFDETDYTVKSFNGTVVWSLIQTGATMLGTVLLYAGGMVVKIIGAAVILASNIVPRLLTEVGVSEESTFNPTARQYEYAAPLAQKLIPAYMLSNDLIQYISTYRVVKLVTPYGNLYAWKNDGDNTYIHTALYANLLYKSSITKVTSEYGGVTHYALRNEWDSVLTTYTLHFYIDHPAETGTMAMPFFDALGFNDDDTSSNQLFGLIDDESDVALRLRVCMSLANLYYAAINYRLHQSGQADSYLSTGGIAYTGAVNVADWQNYIVSNLLSNWSNANFELYHGATVLAICCEYNIAPSWSDINNKLLAYIRNYVENESGGMMMSRFLTNNSSASGLYSFRGSALPALTFRGDFAIVPPNYEKGSALKAIMAVLCAAAAVAVAIVAIRTITSRVLASRMTDRYIDIQRQWDDLKQSYGTYEYDTLKAAYLKSIRQYNLIARLTGYSTLSAVQGWELGNSTNALSSAGFTNNEQLNGGLGMILGVDPESPNITLAGLFRVITGHN